MVYDQSLAKEGKSPQTCAFYAVLGAIVDRFKLETPQEKLEEYIDASKRRFATVPWIMQHLKEHPFEGYRCTHTDIFFNAKLPHGRMDAPKAMQFKNLARFGEKLVVLAVKTHKTDKKKLTIDLNKDHFLVSYPGLPSVMDHAVYLRGWKNGKTGPTYTLVNSWGTDFGNEGEFYIVPDCLYGEITAIYTFHVEKI